MTEASHKGMYKYMNVGTAYEVVSKPVVDGRPYKSHKVFEIISTKIFSEFKEVKR
jgi:hypothetical protein